MERPGSKRLGWGIALGIIGVIGLCTSGGKRFSYIAVCLIMLAIAIILLISYSKDMKLYRDAVRNMFSNNRNGKKK